MAVKKPLVMGADGRPQVLQAGDTLLATSSSTDLMAMTNGEAGAVVIGAPVYIFGANTIKKAQANAVGAANTFGLVYDTTIANGAVGQIAKNGLVSATTAQWDAVTGQTGGLTPGANYFLDATTSGKITTTPPATAGQIVLELGTAISTTDFDVDIQTPYLL